MEDYAECHKSHSQMGGKTDGCQEFMVGWRNPFGCLICDCHRNFHRKVKLPAPIKYKTVVAYTKCQKIHDFKFQNSADGCQEFTPTSEQGEGAIICATCGCKKGFHCKEVTKEETST